MLTRPDLRLPLSMMVVGPSASNFFQGGETGLGLRCWESGGGVDTLRRLAGLSSSSVSVFVVWFRPFVVACDNDGSAKGFSSNSSSDFIGVKSESLLSPDGV